MRKLLCLAVAVLMLFACSSAMAQAPQAPTAQEVSKEKIVAIATEEVTAKGYNLEGVTIIYDDGNRLWEETIGKMTELNSPNFGIFKKGFMKNYRTVYFDFKDPLPDVWVFIDKDTGEVLELYQVR
jgi:hypothetical protein